jgi:hypothetical protein
LTIACCRALQHTWIPVGIVGEAEEINVKHLVCSAPYFVEKLGSPELKLDLQISRSTVT